MPPFKTDSDDARRLAAWKAEGQWYKDNQERLDGIYDELVALRDRMGRKLGYEGYTELGYYRMERNCYDKKDVEKFRESVVKYLVPVASEVYKKQAKRLSKDYPMSFADNALAFRSGNARPVGTPDDILKQGGKFYDALSPETSAFFRTMLEGELLDVLSTEGKAGGGIAPASRIMAFRLFLRILTAHSTMWKWSLMRRGMPLPHGLTGIECRWKPYGLL